MIRSRCSRGIGVVLLLVVGVLTQSGGAAMADQPVGSLSLSLASGTTATEFAIAGWDLAERPR